MRRLILIFMLLIPVEAFAQSGDGGVADGRYFHMPVNLSLHVTQYRDYSLGRALGGGRPVVNYIGANIISGRAARLRGIEAGTIGNALTEDMFGVMAAGFGNVVKGNGLGVQVAGVANVVEGSFSFIQAGGIVNVVEGRFYGMQAGGVANVVEHDVAGFQFAGVANVVEGSFHGVQGAVVANVSEGGNHGIQMGGIANVVESDALGVQLGGIANVGDGSFMGVQAAGIANVVNANALGVRAAGIANIANGNFTGTQAAGIANVVNANALGTGFAGIANVCNGNFQGVLGSGLVNVVNSEFDGIQVAGFANVVDGRARGVQAAGLFNVATNADRLLQVGAVNASRNGSVLPLGLYSVVGDAPEYYEYWVSETGFVNAGIRSGSEWFHNLVFAGMQMNDPVRWSLGWGAGVHRPLADRFAIDIEGSVQHINEDEFWTNEKNFLGKVRLLCQWEFSDAMSLYAGPSFNYLVSRVNDGSDIAPWSLSDEYSGGKWKRSWVGIDMGIRLVQPDYNAGFFNIFDFMSM